MFAFDTMAPINALFALFLVGCLAACVVGIIQTRPGERAEGDVPDAFRRMSRLGDTAAEPNGHTPDGARRGGAHGTRGDGRA